MTRQITFRDLKLETKSFPINKPHDNTLYNPKLAKTRVLEKPPTGRPDPTGIPVLGHQPVDRLVLTSQNRNSGSAAGNQKSSPLIQIKPKPYQTLQYTYTMYKHPFPTNKSQNKPIIQFMPLKLKA